MSSLSVIVIVRNEENNIPECLEAVRWADEIVVVDTGSTDNTIALAKTFTTKVFFQQWEGFGAARNFALNQCTKDWVLSVDADERVTPELKEEIRLILQKSEDSLAGYAVPIKACFLGKWIMHCGWYPAYKIRLFRRQGSRYLSESKLHEGIQLQGNVQRLNNDLLHYTDPNLFHYFEKLNHYTSLAADQLVHEKLAFRISQLLGRPLWTFFKMYFIQAGFRDGIQGLILCVLSSCYVFTKYAKLWERTANVKICK
ncbi:MAG: glycosyltransferase family 2 protein [Ignavibacteriales bacterium]|nr:glycosyltransferase family 2 protein [Ignavibacteriales bacterium]